MGSLKIHKSSNFRPAKLQPEQCQVLPVDPPSHQHITNVTKINFPLKLNTVGAN